VDQADQTIARNLQTLSMQMLNDLFQETSLEPEREVFTWLFADRTVPREETDTAESFLDGVPYRGTKNGLGRS
jgi:hypothetical protein